MSERALRKAKADVPKILIIMLDPPDPTSLKAGLYLNAIRHHVAIGLDVYVASLTPVEPAHHTAVEQLGATLIDFPQARAYVHAKHRFWMRLRRKLRLGAKPDLWLLDDHIVSHIRQAVQPFCVLGLQSYQTGMAARWLAKTLFVPYLCWEHLSGYIRQTKFCYPERDISVLFENAHAVLGVSHVVIDAIKSRYGLNLDNGVIMPNPIPEGFRTPPQSPPPDWMIDFARGRFLFAAWTSWRNDNKRLDLLLDAFSLLTYRRSDVAMIVAGPYRPQDNEAIERRGLSDSAVLAGTLTRDEVHHLSHFADCCCVPSNHETFGLPLLEAMAAGRPTISTACGGPSEILDRSELGRLVPVGDVNAFAKAMEDVCGSDFDNTFIADTAEKRYGEQAQLARWQALYTSILDDAQQ